jgi:hypothetical protein
MATVSETLESEYCVTPKGRALMARLGITNERELLSIAALCAEFEDAYGIDVGETLESQCTLVELGYLRWDADLFGFALLADGEEYGFVALCDVSMEMDE